ncbi:GNAT family N-acetyltransferase [Demequina sp.]|uniref:GNAT family N-acetyltransferase n=1 Tax=Demequina sp. TaxID=2050685 RepID=UPI0025BC5C0A|nr:GNAT family N-acetyltransferase [Demequina sp.]
MSGPVVRRIRADEWERVRDLRLESLADSDAAVAFLETLESSRELDPDFWRERASNGAKSEVVAQLVAEDDGVWVGSVAVLVRRRGDTDHHGVVSTEDRADVVGVYVRPTHRGKGVLDALLAHAANWTRAAGFDTLTLDVHRDNPHARSAYARCGFVETGRTFTGVIGPEIECALDLGGEGGASH